QLIQQHLSEVRETLPVYLLQRLSLVSKKEAILNIHFPKDLQALNKAERRLKFEELFFIQLQLLNSKVQRERRFKGHTFAAVGDKVNVFYREVLPFELTNAQK